MNVNMIDGATVAACVKRLESYEIDEFPVVHFRAFAASEIVIEEPSKGAVVGEGILSFTGNLSAQNQEDVMHAFLFASLVANKQFPYEYQGKEWYYKFVEVMTSAGWLTSQKYYNDMNISGNTVRMDQLVLEILGSVVAGLALPGTASALMLKVAGDAITALKKKETALTLYEKNMLEHGVGGMAAGTCTEVNGEVTLALGTVRFIRKNTATQVLFMDWDTREVQLYQGESVFRKVPYIADQTRDMIRTKLGAHAVNKIEDYEI
ncbi:hypothetical protein ACS77_16050 [Pseudomonas syringae]|uniref:Uncharacterized protein n=1 Tax=Pseudomonas syringae TaxID=317 RepID=A0A0L1MDC8_PSESX|nr:hypothetical protein ACS77_16050 [Pseudomonas syringae]